MKLKILKKEAWQEGKWRWGKWSKERKERKKR